MPTNHDDKGDAERLDLTQYAAILRALVEHLGDLNPRAEGSSTMWIMRCVSACFHEGARKADIDRAIDVVTALSWLLVHVLGKAEADQLPTLVEGLLTNEVPQLEAEGSVPRIVIDPRLVEAFASLDVDEDAFAAADEAGTLATFALQELEIANFILHLDTPDVLEHLRDDRE